MWGDNMEVYWDSRFSAYRRRWTSHTACPQDSPSYDDEYYQSSLPCPSQNSNYSSTNDSHRVDYNPHRHSCSYQPSAHCSSQNCHYSDRNFHSSAHSYHYPVYDCYRKSPSVNSYHYPKGVDYWEEPFYGCSSFIRHPDPSSNRHQVNPPIIEEVLPQPTNYLNEFDIKKIEAIRAIVCEAKEACRVQVKLWGRKESETSQSSLVVAHNDPPILTTPLTEPAPLRAPQPSAPPPEMPPTPLSKPSPTTLVPFTSIPELPFISPPIAQQQLHQLSDHSITCGRISPPLEAQLRIPLSPALRVLLMVPPLEVKLTTALVVCRDDLADELLRRRVWDPGGREEDKTLFQP